ncbi:MAG: efflux RND transporter permease subunit [Patescibacteria group bacterium]
MNIAKKLIDLIFNNLRIFALLFLFIIVFGAYNLVTIEKSGFPDVKVNISLVSVVYPNATVGQVEDEVLGPLEAAISELDDVSEYQSSAYDSFAYVLVEFDAKADIDQAFEDLQSTVAKVKLPEDAKEAQVEDFSINQAGDFMFTLAGSEDDWELYNLSNQFVSTLESVKGVKEVVVANPVTPEIAITLNTEQLKEKGISHSQVEAAFKQSQFAASVGSFDSENDETVNVAIEQTLTTVGQIRDMVIAPGVKLADVAVVETRLNNNDFYNRVGFRKADNVDSKLYIQRGFVYTVFTKQGSDIIEVGENIDEAIAEFTADQDREVHVTTALSMGEQTQQQVDEISQSLFGKRIDEFGTFGFIGYCFGGLGLVVILLLIFMNIRVAILAALAIPVSLFSTLIILGLMGVGLNTLVLFSMVLVIGLVVDPTIVFLESVQRFRDRGVNGREAAVKAVQTVGLGVFLAIATNIIVFVPFGVVSGFFGEIIQYIPLTVIPAMIVAMFIPLFFFVPVAAKLMKPKKRDHYSNESSEMVGVWPAAQYLGKAITWLLDAGKMKIVLRVVVFLIIFSIPLAVVTGSMQSGAVEVVQFSQPDDADQVLVYGSFPDDWNFERAVYEAIVPLQDELTNYPEVTAFNYFQQQGTSFVLILNLLPIEVREEEGLQTASELSSSLNNRFDELELDGDIRAVESSEGPPQEMYPIQVQIFDQDTEVLKTAVADITSYLEEQEAVTTVENDFDSGSSKAQVTFALDPSDPRSQGPFMTFALLNDRLAEKELGAITLNDVKYEIVSNVYPEVNDLDEIRNTQIPQLMPVITPDQIPPEQIPEGMTVEQYIQTLMPAPVYLKDVIKSETVKEPETVQRLNGDRYVEVRAALRDDADVAEVQTALQEYLSDEKLAELNLSADDIQYKGELDMITDSFTDLFIALGIAIFLIYVLLVGFFRSYIEPFIILFAIPLGLVGVFGAVAATTGQLGLLELLGVVTMAGIVVNVTILLIDYANQLKRKGRSPAEAIATSVAIRFRPIVLTQMTAFGSLIPLVIISPYWQGLASAIVFGIISSAFLSLFVTPILYVWSNTIMRTINRIPKGGSWMKSKYQERSKGVERKIVSLEPNGLLNTTNSENHIVR